MVIDIVELLNPPKLFLGVVCGSGGIEKKKETLPFICSLKHESFAWLAAARL